MADTKDIIGEQATIDGLVSRSLTSFEESDATVLHYRIFYGHQALTSIKMPKVKTIGADAFYDCGITEISADCFPSLTNAESYVFRSSKKLTRAEFSSLTKTSTDTFNACESLQFFKMSSTEKIYIGSSFTTCPKLTEFVILSNSVANLSSIQAFSGTPISANFGVVYVPRSLVDDYKQNVAWRPLCISPWEDYPVLPQGTITDDWTNIIASELDGTYLTKYKIGDTKYQIIGDYLVDLEIIAFDKDDLADGSGKAHITWLGRHIVFLSKMNSTASNAGGWGSCELRSNLISMLEASDATFKNVVKSVNKTYYNYTTSTTETIADMIWIPSVLEVNGTMTPIESSGVTYDNITTSRCNNINNNYGWWLRSTYSNARDFRYISTSGGSGNSTSANTTFGVVLGVCT